ncbi:hypothetical protein F4778DRAFT_783023 [Xylariomycetidae sp. FL2044]|nr:hypothetical protein F4778DRAFT_783023 [Xylariomycetidae sp. FL2044]
MRLQAIALGNATLFIALITQTGVTSAVNTGDNSNTLDRRTQFYKVCTVPDPDHGFTFSSGGSTSIIDGVHCQNYCSCSTNGGLSCGSLPGASAATVLRVCGGSARGEYRCRCREVPPNKRGD